MLKSYENRFVRAQRYHSEFWWETLNVNKKFLLWGARVHCFLLFLSGGSWARHQRCEVQLQLRPAGHRRNRQSDQTVGGQSRYEVYFIIIVLFLLLLMFVMRCCDLTDDVFRLADSQSDSGRQHRGDHLHRLRPDSEYKTSSWTLKTPAVPGSVRAAAWCFTAWCLWTFFRVWGSSQPLMISRRCCGGWRNPFPR